MPRPSGAILGIIALIVSEEGFPLAYEVIDRAIVSEENLELLRSSAVCATWCGPLARS